MDNATGYKSLPLLDDEQYETITRIFYDKYSGKGLSPSEIFELHHSELWQMYGETERDLCYVEYDKLAEDLRLTRNGYSDLKAENTKLKSEVKAGAGMLADMHDKAQSVSQAVKGERERIMGIIAASSYSKPDSLDLVLPFETWQELCRIDGHILRGIFLQTSDRHKENK